MTYYHISWDYKVEEFKNLEPHHIFVDNDPYNNPRTHCCPSHKELLEPGHNLWTKVYDCGGPEAYRPLFTTEEAAKLFLCKFYNREIENNKQRIETLTKRRDAL